MVFSLVATFAMADMPARRPLSPFDAILKHEAKLADLPFDIADAVVAIESSYDPTRIGDVGEIGLMQVRPATASMLGFTGTAGDLAKPEINIHYGVRYLADAWHQANGDLCRALMKYRAGHGSDTMTPLSVLYCQHAIAHLTAMGSSFSNSVVPQADVFSPSRLAGAPTGPIPKLDLKLKGSAFWARHDARVRMLTARVERRWRRLASR